MSGAITMTKGALWEMLAVLLGKSDRCRVNICSVKREGQFAVMSGPNEEPHGCSVTITFLDPRPPEVPKYCPQVDDPVTRYLDGSLHVSSGSESTVGRVVEVKSPDVIVVRIDGEGTYEVTGETMLPKVQQ